MRTAAKSVVHKRVVLLDFDGVVSRNKAADAYIADRIARVMEHATGIRNQRMLRKMNERMYKEQGHTWLGLRASGYNMSLDEFNAILYGQQELFTHLSLSVRETFELSKFMLKCVSLDTDVMLYSNADNRWLQHFVQWSPMLYAVQDNVIGPSRLLKPTEEAHWITDMFLRSRGYTDVKFVDDSIINFKHIPSHWTPVLFGSSGAIDTCFSKPATLGSSYLHICHHLNEVL